jgi:hypothetical protein
MAQANLDISLMKPTRVRYGVLFFICTLSMLTYLDRVCISRVQEDMQTDLDYLLNLGIFGSVVTPLAILVGMTIIQPSLFLISFGRAVC